MTALPQRGIAETLPRKRSATDGTTTNRSSISLRGGGHLKIDDEVQIVLITTTGEVAGHRTGGSGVAIKTASDLVGDRIQTSLRGQPTTGERGTVRAAQLLMRKLNGQGANWRLVDRCAEGTGVDVEFKDVSGNVLSIQHTRAANEALLGPLSRARDLRSLDDPDQLADAILASASRKQKKLHGDVRHLVLLLDAVETPSWAFGIVAQRFTGDRLARLRELRFAAVWLVGPDDALIHRLDP